MKAGGVFVVSRSGAAVRKKPPDRAVDDAVNLLVALVRNDDEIFARDYGFRADLMGLVLPLLMIGKVMALYIAHVDPDWTAESLLEEYTRALAAQEPVPDRIVDDASRDAAALALAWYRGDQAAFEQLLEPYRHRGELLASAVANVVIQIVRAIDPNPDQQEPMIRIAGDTVRAQIKRTLEDKP